MKKFLNGVALVVLTLGAAAGYYVYDQMVNVTHRERVLSVVTLDDGAMIALEELSKTERREDPSTNQMEETETISYRLRRYEAASGKDLAKREIDGAPECVAAAGGRAWCRWTKEGRVHLLDEKLQTAGSYADRVQVEKLATDREGALLVMGMDGVPTTVDAKSGKTQPRATKAQLSPFARAGKITFELSTVPGQKRAAVRAGGKILDPKLTWIADGFLTGGEGEALPVEDALFLVHRDTIAADSPRRLTRLTHAIKPVWTSALPEPVESASLQGEVVVLVARTRSVGVAVADGKIRFTTPHR